MPQFRIKDTIPCYVTWTYTVEADSESAAREAFIDQDESIRPVGLPDIGDCVDFLPQTTVIEQTTFD